MVRHHCDFSSELLLHDPQSATKLLRHYPQMVYFREQNNLRLSPFPQSKVECLLQVSCTATQHCVEGVGEEKLHFPLLKSAKRHKGPLTQGVSANFVAAIEVAIGLVLFLARDFSNNHTLRRCKK